MTLGNPRELRQSPIEFLSKLRPRSGRGHFEVQMQAVRTDAWMMDLTSGFINWIPLQSVLGLVYRTVYQQQKRNGEYARTV